MTDFEKMIVERLDRIESELSHIRYGDGQSHAYAMMRLARAQGSGDTGWNQTRNYQNHSQDHQGINPNDLQPMPR